MQRLLTHAIWILRYYGFRSVLSKSIGTIISPLRRQHWYVREQELAFDQRFGVDTAGLIDVSALDIAEGLRMQAVEYSPTPGASLGVILQELEINYSDFTFVDFGCGKGKAMFMAAAFPFAQVIGCEISQKLCESAWANIASCKTDRLACRAINCFQTSATDFELPTTPVVVYFFNPFGAELLSQVLHQLKCIQTLKPRPTIAIYCNPVHKILFEESEMWQRYTLKNGDPPSGWAVYRSQF